MDVRNGIQIPSNAKVRKYLRRILFGKNIFCPVCGTHKVKSSRKRYWCGKCRLWFSLLSHTWLSGMDLSLQVFWLVLWCFTKQIPVKQTESICLLSEKTVRHYFHLFRINLPQDRVLLEHMVQLDEAYFGGMLGYALLMGKQKGTRKLAYTVFSHNTPSKLDALDFLKQYISPQSLLATDGGSIYKNIQNHYPVSHMVDIHKKFEFTNTSEIEGMFGVLRTFIRRMYHHVTAKYFPEIMLEFYYRFSHPKIFSSPYEYLLNTLYLRHKG